MGTTPTTQRERPDWRLRGLLATALVALLATALSVSASGNPSASHASAGHQSSARHRASKTAHVGSSTTAVAGTTTGSVTRSAIGGGCGFTLALERSNSSSARPVGQCTILEIGDSLGNDLGWGIERHVSTGSGLTLVQADKSSTGLANTSFFSWPTTLASDLRQYHPDLVLICLGGNDQQGIYVNGSPVQFPSPTWAQGYLARVKQLADEASKAGAYVAWVGLPIMQQPSYSEGAHILDGLYKAGVTAVPNGTFISTWSVFANPAGQFQSNAVVNGTPTTLRESDGIHYSFSGEDVMATYVLRELAAVYHVALHPTQPAVVTSWS